MIKVIDKVRYTPKNEIMNKVLKDIVAGMKKKLGRIRTGGKYVTVTLSGDCNKIKVSVTPDDDKDLINRIEKELGL